ncbi:methylaspartate mutase [Actinorhabdospora filicis]|uniref:Methylaspartate mutase n=1 Tax=Actinorhabdospora filicis TaxID=1785913 RepID=A0A9W6SJM7_9ACTN|nr:methylaspartate mutase [Actinorhabdospora filicis]GLZ78269.1 methylaspartate mutase [Actinorhabdospora filicis]
MSEIPGLRIERRVAAALPPWPDIVAWLRRTDKPTVAAVLAAADRRGVPVVQPRCGVGDHERMRELLQAIEAEGRPSVLTLTIDSYTRLKHFRSAAEALRRDPAGLNGYPLVAHGWRRGRDLDASVRAPLQVRHGSPDGRELFAVTLAAGITSFEGGGLSYNLPYSKNVPLAVSLEAWRQIDAVCGILADEGVPIDREMFGSLTGVLVPPAISLAVCLLEACSAAAEGVRCVSIAYPQGGEVHQDVAALRAIRSLAAKYLPERVAVYPVLHTFMGVFPRTTATADALIHYAGLTARLGGAVKVINKTNQEAYGIPDAATNALGVRTTAMAFTPFLDFVTVDEVRVEEERYWIEREVAELVDPVLDQADGQRISAAVEKAFADGRLDIPFSASVHARAEVMPRRDAGGGVRYQNYGRLPFSRATRRRNEQCLRGAPGGDRLIEAVTADINYFLAFDRHQDGDDHANS